MRQPDPYRIIHALYPPVVVALNGASFGVVLEIVTIVVRIAAWFSRIRLCPLVWYERRSVKHGSRG